MRIVFIASECAPFAKTGGLADVVSALPRALQALGHEVIVVMPRYASIASVRHNLEPFFAQMGVWMGDGLEWCAVHRAENRGVPVYFIESNKYFDRWGLYCDVDNRDFDDNPRRYAFLTRAGLQLCRDLGFAPDIVHVHDWQTALGTAYLKIWHWNDALLGQAASVLTIHNLAYQGKYPAGHMNYLGLQWNNFTADKLEDNGQINFLKGGIQYADAVNTVSPTYAAETRSTLGGFGLAPYLNDKGENYVGILNGADYDDWDPATNHLIPAAYTAQDLSGKAVCKGELQRRLFLEENPQVPLIGVVSRFAEQKGLRLLAEALDAIVNQMAVQFAVLGAGEKDLEDFFGNAPARYRSQVGSFIGYNDELAHWIEAGSDFFLMPSLSEPCGLNQIYSLKYGTLPIVRATGGLDDTIQQYDERTGRGTGFKFVDATPGALYNTVGWAVATYYDRPAHIQRMIQTAMAQDYSWERSAKEYVRLYERTLANKRDLQLLGRS